MIRILPDRLSVLDSTGQEYGIRCSEVHAVHAARFDLVTDSTLILTFDFDFGEFIEVDEGTEGFEELVSRLGEHLPLADDFRRQLDAVKSGGKSATLFHRT